ncbi:P-loop containing nucleoside triphosphate hydrolases superfamily protein [Artemisia annua]|uniref:P-loop containing nucleoside triphosphate hydrolases superfamily protein n=1 Tax=Artemisia annua TaxID=35608 RepID=A0A2U1MXS8_ARTAN|nr:P-loop containing nucleoside triphosphate hydrolases superfamily protein [Artemisia annua]
MFYNDLEFWWYFQEKIQDWSMPVNAEQGAALVVLPEMWNCPYSSDSFTKFAEDFKDKHGSLSFFMLSELAYIHSITIVGGSVPELDDNRLYNTCCVELICYPSAFNIATGSMLCELEQQARQLNLDRLLAKMWEAMGLVRVYTKPQGPQPDFSDPVDRGGYSVEDFCNQIHRTLVKEVKYVLDEDVVQIVKKKGMTLLRLHVSRVKKKVIDPLAYSDRGKESEGRGRFKMHTTGPDRIADRVKKAPLKN